MKISWLSGNGGIEDTTSPERSAGAPKLSALEDRSRPPEPGLQNPTDFLLGFRGSKPLYALRAIFGSVTRPANRIAQHCCLRTILIGGIPLAEKFVMKIFQREGRAAQLFVVFAQLQDFEFAERVVKIRGV